MIVKKALKLIEAHDALRGVLVASRQYVSPINLLEQTVIVVIVRGDRLVRQQSLDLLVLSLELGFPRTVRDLLLIAILFELLLGEQVQYNHGENFLEAIDCDVEAFIAINEIHDSQTDFQALVTIFAEAEVFFICLL